MWSLFPVAAAAFGQGYIHKMLVFNFAPLIVSAGGYLRGCNSHTHICLPFTHTHSFSSSDSPLRYLCRFSGFVMALLVWFGAHFAFRLGKLDFLAAKLQFKMLFRLQWGGKLWSVWGGSKIVWFSVKMWNVKCQ